MRRSSLLCLGSLLLACGSRSPMRSATGEVNRPAQDDACFGGPSEVITTKVGAGSADFANGEATALYVAGANLLWQEWGGPTSVNLASRERAPAIDRHYRAFFKTADDHEAYSVAYTSREERENGLDLIASDLKTGKTRIVLAAKDDDTGLSAISSVVLDGEHVYFTRPRMYGRPNEKNAFFRIRRDGTGDVERMGPEPRAGRAPILIHEGYVYWSPAGGDGSDGGPSLWRRALAPASADQRLVSTKEHQLPLFIANGRLFYVDAPGVFSVPTDGSAPATLHAASEVAQTSVLADRACVYFTGERGIARVRLGQAGAKPELIADEDSYQGGPIVTDGRHLYWIDRRHDRILAMGHAAASLPERPALVAKIIEAKDMPADVARADSKVLVGDGWGCAKVFGWSQPHWQCWSSTGQAAGKPIKAKFVPGLSPNAEPAVGTDRLCFLGGEAGKCWAWTKLLDGKPADFAPPQSRQGRFGQWLVGGTFACLLHYVGAERMLVCSGDNGFGQLAGNNQPIALERWEGSLGTWHGCVSGNPEGPTGQRQDPQLRCWGRGDAGQLGRVPEGQCTVNGKDVPCDENLRIANFTIPGQPTLFAGDMFTCAAFGYPRELRCWGGSRDGWFGDAACSPELRQAWPIGGGFVPAPKATCSTVPLRIVEPGSTIGAISVGPRGACVIEDDKPHCVGAITTPSAPVDRIAVSNGAQANACGIDGERVLCWGDGYSPPGQPAQAAPIAFEATTPTSAVVDNAPPAGTTWTDEHLIHHGCDRIPITLPTCDAQATGQPWSELAAKVDSLQKQRVSIQDRLLVGPREDSSFEAAPCTGPVHGRRRGSNPPPSIGTIPTGCHLEQRRIVLGGSASPLRFWDRSGTFQCIGDESRLCCGAPAFGQTVIATGVLTGSVLRGWGLQDAKVCEVAAR